MAVPASDQVNDLLAARLGPTLDELGLRRLSRLSYPAWASSVVDEEGRTRFFSLQVDAKATDPFSGGGFRIELEKSMQQRPAQGLNGRALFFQLMTVDELRVVLAHQNSIIESLPQPPPEHIELYPEGPIRRQYLSYFQPQPTFDAVNSWLRFLSEDHLYAWSEVLTPLVQPLVGRAGVYLTPDRRDLGKGYLLTAS